MRLIFNLFTGIGYECGEYGPHAIHFVYKTRTFSILAAFGAF
jgi:hypothetical protein